MFSDDRPSLRIGRTCQQLLEILELSFNNNANILKCYYKISTLYHNQGDMYEKSLKYINMGFTGMFSVETVLKIIGFGVKG
uniref:Uncharacterized protein n=1 Tax=Glossina pallidipes TaxID=7398 RepID=A0A1B0A0Y3_GLOPL